MKKLPFYDLIDSLYCHKEIAEFYTYSHDSDHFAVGKIIDYSQEEVAIQAIDSCGYKDGFFIGRIKDICRISTQTSYIKSLQKLYQNNYVPKEESSVIHCQEDNIKRNLYSTYIQRIICKHDIVTCTLYCDVSVIGFIDNVTNQLVKMRVIAQDGSYNGVTFFYVNDIETLSFDGSEENKYIKIIGNKNTCK